MSFDLESIVITIIICWTVYYTVQHVLAELLEQRRRETKTGEFEDKKEDE